MAKAKIKLYFYTLPASENGEVVAYIDNKKYTYLTPAANHNQWKQDAIHTPGAVLGAIKYLVSTGRAQLLSKSVSPIAAQMTAPEPATISIPKTQNTLDFKDWLEV